jgi:16S rRNA processing protein RimM
LPSEPPARPVELAAVAKAQGLRGEVALKLFNPASSLWEVGRRFWVAGRWMKLEAFRAGPRGAVVKLEGISSREEAERLVGLRLSVDRAELPALGDQETYLADLVGWTVLDAAGRKLGTVVGVEASGTRDYLVVEEGGRQELWPATPEVIGSIDAAARMVRLTLESTE